MRPTTRRHLVETLVGLAGTIVLLVGVLSLWVWDAPVPPTGLIETDLDGLDCGAPLDNPGWDTGQPCHGAVNRQTAMGWVLVVVGTASIAAAVWSRLARRPQPGRGDAPPGTASPASTATPTAASPTPSD